MKKAFTLIELIMVIVIVGILAFVLLPRQTDNRLITAANQVAKHIRYTQHLALMSDKFDANDTSWFKNYWQIYFHQIPNNIWSGSNDDIGYTIFSDIASVGAGARGNPNSETEIARNPQQSNLILSPGHSGTGVVIDKSKLTPELNLTKTYGISDVSFSNTCRKTTDRRLHFDQRGRPHFGANLNDANENLVTNTCVITLTGNAGNMLNILVYPETGRVCIDHENAGNC